VACPARDLLPETPPSRSWRRSRGAARTLRVKIVFSDPALRKAIIAAKRRPRHGPRDAQPRPAQR